MRGFGKDRDNERFQRPKALALKHALPSAAILIAASTAIGLALVFSIIVSLVA